MSEIEHTSGSVFWSFEPFVGIRAGIWASEEDLFLSLGSSSMATSGFFSKSSILHQWTQKEEKGKSWRNFDEKAAYWCR